MPPPARPNPSLFLVPPQKIRKEGAKPKSCFCTPPTPPPKKKKKKNNNNTGVFFVWSRAGPEPRSFSGSLEVSFVSMGRALRRKCGEPRAGAAGHSTAAGPGAAAALAARRGDALGKSVPFAALPLLVIKGIDITTGNMCFSRGLNQTEVFVLSFLDCCCLCWWGGMVFFFWGGLLRFFHLLKNMCYFLCWF